MKRLKDFLLCFYKAGENTVYHDGIEHAGYLAFLGLLALFPFLVFLMALGGTLGRDLATPELIELIISNLPEHMVEGVRPRVEEIINGPSQGLLTVAILGAIWTSSSAVEGIRTVLNRAYRVHTPPRYIWRRLVSIVQIIMIITMLTVIIICGMAMLVVWPVAWEYIKQVVSFDMWSATEDFRNVSYMVASLLLLFVISFLYYVITNVKQTLRSVLPGAIVAVIGWMGAAKLFSYYLARFEMVNLIYGSLGSIIAALLFFYILGVIFIYGAEFNYLLMKLMGERIEEKEEVVETNPPLEDEL
ncbi:MAG: YihY/virulence factor BrkB family protein, partial [Rickettsiales bacterium]